MTDILPSPPFLLPLLLAGKKDASTQPVMALIDTESQLLNLEARSEQSDSPFNASIPLALVNNSYVRTRPGNEITLVLKYRLLAPSEEQKTAWLAKFASIGIQTKNDSVTQEDGTKDLKDGKRKRSGSKRKSHSSSDNSEVAGSKTKAKSSDVSLTSSSNDTIESSPKVNRIGSDNIAMIASSPPVSPHSERRDSPRSFRRADSPRGDSPRRSSPHISLSLARAALSDSDRSSSLSPKAHSSYSTTESTLVVGSSTALTGDSQQHKIEITSANASPRVVHDSSKHQSEQSEQTKQVSEALSELELEPTSPFARLIRIHGARNNIHCSLVNPNSSSLNKNDCFILDDGKANFIYTWRGKSANMFVKSECQDLAQVINQSTYQGKAKVMQVEQGLESASFWDNLSTGKGDIADSDSTGIVSIAKLLKLKSQDGKTEIDSETSRITSYDIVCEGRSAISSSQSGKGVFALDTGFEILICDTNKPPLDPSHEEDLINTVRRYKRDKSRPIHVKVSFIQGNTKHPLFKHFVHGW